MSAHKLQALYNNLFNWLVGRINRSTGRPDPLAAVTAESVTVSAYRRASQHGVPVTASLETAASSGTSTSTIALLDIFGFESFKVNRYV
jgi:myosin heavy subunit